jgi:hypothetical protein
VRGVVGRLRRSRGGLGEEWRWEDEWSSSSGERAAWRQRGRGDRGGKRWESGHGGATQRGGVLGAGPDRWTALDSGPSVALAGDVRRARVAGGNREGRDV